MNDAVPQAPVSPEAAALAAPAQPERFWSLVREALRGSRRDLTILTPRRAIMLIAIPMVIEMVMESVFAVVDIFWVSKLGPDAIAAVGLTESMLVIVYAFAMGLSMGVAAVVARRTGEKDAHGAASAAVQAIILGVGLAAVVGLLGATLGPRLLVLMGASPAWWPRAATSRA
jgi:Na+-driven multidrug efflux pump